MKILLDIQDVDKLLTGQTEAGIELKNYVVQEFVNKYLRGIVNEDIVKKAIVEAEGMAQSIMYGSNNYRMKATVQKSIEDNVKKVLDDKFQMEIESLRSQSTEILKAFLEKINKENQEKVWKYEKQIEEYETKCAEIIKEACEFSTDEIRGRILAKLAKL